MTSAKMKQSCWWGHGNPAQQGRSKQHSDEYSLKSFILLRTHNPSFIPDEQVVSPWLPMIWSARVERRQQNKSLRSNVLIPSFQVSCTHWEMCFVICGLNAFNKEKNLLSMEDFCCVRIVTISTWTHHWPEQEYRNDFRHEFSFWPHRRLRFVYSTVGFDGFLCKQMQFCQWRMNSFKSEWVWMRGGRGVGGCAEEPSPSGFEPPLNSKKLFTSECFFSSRSGPLLNILTPQRCSEATWRFGKMDTGPFFGVWASDDWTLVLLALRGLIWVRFHRWDLREIKDLCTFSRYYGYFYPLDTSPGLVSRSGQEYKWEDSFLEMACVPELSVDRKAALCPSVLFSKTCWGLAVALPCGKQSTWKC